MNIHPISKAGDGFTDDPANSLTPDAPYYFDPGVYRGRVARSIFQRNWLYFCHTLADPTEGDYLMGEIAGQSIYVVRDRDGCDARLLQRLPAPCPPAAERQRQHQDRHPLPLSFLDL